MPKGLPDVIQKFGAENWEYLRALNENREAVEQFVEQVRALEERQRAAGRTEEEVARRSESLYQAKIDTLKNYADALRAVEEQQMRADAYEGEFADNRAMRFSKFEAGAKRAQAIQADIAKQATNAAAMQEKYAQQQERAAALVEAAQEKVAVAAEKAAARQVATEAKVAAARETAAVRWQAQLESISITTARVANAGRAELGKLTEKYENMGSVVAETAGEIIALHAAADAAAKSGASGAGWSQAFASAASEGMALAERNIARNGPFTVVPVSGSGSSGARGGNGLSDFMDAALASSGFGSFSGRGGGSGGGGYGAYVAGAAPDDSGGLSASLLAAMAGAKRASGFHSIVPGLLAGAGVSSLLALLGGGGGGGGGGIGAIAGGIGSFAGGATAGLGGGGGNAAGTWQGMAGRIAQWYPRIHWAMMLTNEVLATAGPAAIAALGATAVGWQGGAQLANRYQALNAVQESMGPTTGQSIGSFLRFPSTMQTLQNQFGSGEMYGIAGAGINSLRSGGGTAFLQLGQQTLSMISEAAANFTLAMKGGLGKAAGDIVQGGAGYLQQFGDIAGNVGKTFMNTAQYLPGVGSDLLSILQGVTGGAAKATGALGPGLLPIMGFEAGSRWGPAIVGGAGSLVGRIGQGFTKMGGTVGGGLGELLGAAPRAATAADVAAGTAGAVGDTMLGGGLAGALGGLGGPEIGLIAASALLVSKGLSAKTGAQQKYGGLASGLNMANLASSLGTISGEAFQGGAFAKASPRHFDMANLAGGASLFGHAGMGTVTGTVGALANFSQLQWSKGLKDLGGVVQDAIGPGGTVHSLGVMLGLVPPEPSAQQAAYQSMSKAFSTWSATIGAPGQVESLWKQGGGGKIGTNEALDILAQSGVNLNTAFAGRDGRRILTATAQQQILNYEAGYQAVTGTVQGGAHGGTLAAINAVGAAGGLNASKVAQVNQAVDTIVGLATGGASGTAGFLTTLGGFKTQVGTKGGGGLGDVTNAANAAAWTAFTGTSQTPGVVSSLESQADWMRQMQVMGALGGGAQSQGGMFKYLLSQALQAPGVSGSPLALSQLAAVAQTYGGPTVHPGESAAGMMKQFSNFLKTGTDTAAQYNKATTVAGEKVSNMSADNQTFITNATNGVSDTLSNAIDTWGAQTQTNFMNAIGGGGMPSQKQMSQYAGFLKASGFNAKDTSGMMAFAAQEAGATPKEIKAIVSYVAHFEKANAPHLKGQITYHSDIPTPKVPVLHGTVIYTGQMAGNVGSAGGHTGSGMQQGFRVPGYGGGDIVPAMLEPGEAVVPKHLVSTLAPFLAAHGVPGFTGMSGAADARMLIQKYGSIQNARSVLGFAAGGVVPPGASAAQLQALINKDWAYADTIQNPKAYETYKHGTIDVLYTALDKLKGSATGAAKAVTSAVTVIDDLNKSLKADKSPFTQFGRQLESGMLAAIHGAPSLKQAQNIANKVNTEVNYAMGVASAAKQGQGYNAWGGGSTLLSTFSGLATPQQTSGGQPYQYYVDQAAAASPSGQPISVQQQMGDYLQAMKSFQGDLGKLSKAGLNKNLMQQLIAAGPLQGDQEAQSILGGAGGAKGANQLWSQINQAANQLGIGTASSIYGAPQSGKGGQLAGDKRVQAGVNANAAPVHQLQAAINSLHGKTVTIKVAVDTGSGGGGGGAGFTKNDINNLVKIVQTKVLEQAKRNRGSNLTLRGYGS